jgi:hypothetical protein
VLFLKYGSRVEASDCWFSIGNYEILGGFEIVQAGIKLLGNTQYRGTGSGGMVGIPQVIAEEPVQEAGEISHIGEVGEKSDCESYEPVSAEFNTYIEEEINKFIGIEERQSEIIDAENFLYTVVGISETGDDIEEAVYHSTDKVGEIIAGHSIVSDDFTHDEKSGYYDEKGIFHPSAHIVRYQKTFADGSEVVMRDGGVFIFKHERWNRCVHGK